jgi:hypothetical protein
MIYCLTKLGAMALDLVIMNATLQCMHDYSF